jgi:glycosyltransferase involved in cell wall biosynthesis
MRIGLVTYGWPEEHPEQHLYVRSLLACLREQGDVVELIALRRGRYAARFAQNLDWRLQEQLLRLNVDVLVEEARCYPALFSINSTLKGLARYPIVSLVEEVEDGWGKRGVVRWLHQIVERSYLRGMDGFVFGNGALRQQVCGWLRRNKPYVVAEPGGDAATEELGAELDWRIAYSRDLAEEPMRLLYVGKLVPHKGLHVLLEALSRLPVNAVTLQVVGRLDEDVSYVQWLKHLVESRFLSKRVYFQGWLSGADLLAQWRKGQVLVWPALRNGLGVTLREAFRYGVVPLAARWGASTELIEHGNNGLLFSAGDVQALTGALFSLVNEREILLEMSRAGHRAYADLPTWRESVQTIYRSLLSWF